jgi:hypothetical protein
MIKKIVLFILLLSSFFCKELRAQASLGFDSAQCVFQNPIFVGTSGANTVAVVSTNSVSYTGFLSILVATEDTNHNINPFDSTSFQSVTINPGAATLLTYTQQYPAFRFPLGIDVVVIWPKASGTITHDTIRYNLNVISPNQIADLLEKGGVSVYPNPCANRLIIENKQTSNPIEKIKIYNTRGELILSRNRESEIDLTQITDAFYVVELFYKSGNRSVIKVEKQSGAITK